MRPLAAFAVLPLLTMLVSGCFGGDDDHPHAVQCDDGSTREYGDMEAHHEEGFDPMALCAPPPLVVTLSGAPATMTAFDTATLTFDLPLAGRDSGHSMDNQIRVATASSAPGPADRPDAYGVQVGRREHQDLPLTFDATFRPTEAGTYYLRGVAQVEDVHIWSDETVVEVIPVAPTGAQVTVTYATGGIINGPEPAQTDASLGDALVFQNDDIVEHTFTFSSGPWSGLAVTVAAGAAAEPILLDVPAIHEVTGDDLPDPTTVRIQVA